MNVIKERIHHPKQSLRWMRLSLPCFALERHRHPQCELTWIERGSGVRLLGDSAAPFAAGDLVLVGSETPHTWVSSSPSETGKVSADSHIATVLQFSPLICETSPMAEMAQLRNLLQDAKRGLQVTGAARDRVTARMACMGGLEPLGQLEQLIGVLRELHLHRVDTRFIASTANEPARSDGPSRRIDRVIQWIHHNIEQPLTLVDAATVAHVTPAAFSRFFRRETGKTFTDYVNDIRCAKACVLLKESRAPIAMIGLQCGFLTGSHFNRQFLARMGQSPRSYRG